MTLPAEALRTHRYPAGASPDQARAWARSLRAELYGLLHLGDALAAPVPLAAQPLATAAPSSLPVPVGFSRFEVSLSATAGRRIPALVTVPDGGAVGLPGVVCLHGHGGTRHAVHDPASIYKGFAHALARRGYVTIAVDVGQHEVYEAGQLLMGERLWDCRRAVDWLVAQERVDPGRIGCAGLSLGGEMAMWLGALDERVAAVVSAGFLTTMDQMERNHCPCWKFDGLRQRVDFADLYALIAPRALQCQNGLAEPDTQFHVPLARRALTEVEPAWVDQGTAGAVALLVHPGGHEVDLPALLAFFATWL